MNCLKNIWSRFIEFGAIAPSSKFLARKMVSQIKLADNLTVVELGPGSGVITREILDRLPLSGKVFAIEINKELSNKLRDTFSDPRLTILTGNALDIVDLLRENGVARADYILSGLPIGSFSKLNQIELLKKIKQCLSDGGAYVQFHYFLVSLGNIKKVFQKVSLIWEPLNIPPAFIITCRK